MKKLLVAACVACMLALTAALVGCGGVSEADKAKVAGTWELESTSDSNVNALVSLLDAAGQKLTVTMTADGKMTSDSLGSGTWELSSATEGTIKQSEGNLKLKMDGEKLVIEGSDGNFIFKKAS